MTRLRKFALNAGILTATSLSLGALGVFYNAWLTQNLGTAGIGLFSLMMAVYRLFVTLASFGAGLAATRLVAEETAFGNGKNAALALRMTLGYSLFFGVLAGMALFFGGQLAAEILVEDIRAAKPFRVLAFSLPFIGVSSALGGYFTAVSRVSATSVSQIFEQLSQMAFTVLVFAIGKPTDIGKACVLVAAGTTVSEGISLLIHGILYLRDRRRHPFSGKGTETVSKIGKRLLGIGLPVGASAVLRSALSTVKHLLVPISLEKSGLTHEKALSEYGIIGGMVLPVLLFPCAFLLGFSNLLVPEVTQYKALGQKERIDWVMETVFRLTLLFAIAVAAALMSFADELAWLLYREPAAGNAIRALAPIVTVMYLDSAVDGILKGLGEQVAVVRYNVYDTALCVLMVGTLVPKAGTVGYLITIVVSEVFNMTLSAMRLVSVTGFPVNMVRWALIPSVAAALSVGVARLFLRLFFLSAKTVAGFTAGIVFMVLAYYGALRLFGCVTREDLHLVRRIFQK